MLFSLCLVALLLSSLGAQPPKDLHPQTRNAVVLPSRAAVLPSAGVKPQPQKSGAKRPDGARHTVGVGPTSYALPLAFDGTTVSLNLGSGLGLSGSYLVTSGTPTYGVTFGDPGDNAHIYSTLPLTDLQQQWVSGATYVPGVIVSDVGVNYQAINAVTSATHPASDSTNWNTLPWVSGVNAFTGQVVSYSGNWYQCLTPTSGTANTITPLTDAGGTTGTYWWNLGYERNNNAFVATTVIGTVSPNLTTVAPQLPFWAGGGWNGGVVQPYIAGKYNCVIGSQAGANMTATNYSTCVGSLAGANLTDGEQNTFVGGGAGWNVRHGFHNTLLGVSAGNGIVDGWYNVIIGCDNGLQVESTYTTSGPGTCSIATNGTVSVANTFQPGQAVKFHGAGLPGNMTADQIYWVVATNGSGADLSATTFTFADNITDYNSATVFSPSSSASGITCYPVPASNVSIGTSCGASCGEKNVFIGSNTGGGYGNSNTAVGFGTGGSLSSGFFNTFLGFDAGYQTSTGFSNTCLGYLGGDGLTTGYQNVCIGQYSGHQLGANAQNVFIGTYAGDTVKSSYNVGIGHQACGGCTGDGSGTQNTFVGYGAGPNISTNCSWNTGTGYECLENMQTGNSNVADGWGALYYSVADIQNTAGGVAALYSLNGGSNNTAYGCYAMEITTAGSYNVGIGEYSGLYAGTANKCTFLGCATGTTSTHQTVTNSTAVGYGATVTADNQVVFGNSSITKVTVPSVANLPSGTLAAPPAGLNVGDVWLDTTASAQYPALRIRAF